MKVEANDKAIVLAVVAIGAMVLIAIGLLWLFSVIESGTNAFVSKMISEQNIPPPIADSLKKAGGAFSAFIFVLISIAIFVPIIMISLKTTARAQRPW